MPDWVFAKPDPELPQTDLDVRAATLLKERGFPPWSARTLLLRWRGVVNDATTQSIIDIYDFFDERMARNCIQFVIDDPGSQRCATFHDWLLQVADLDQKMIGLFRDDVEVLGASTWWERGVLAHGGLDYDEQLRDACVVLSKSHNG